MTHSDAIMPHVPVATVDTQLLVVPANVFLRMRHRALRELNAHMADIVHQGAGFPNAKVVVHRQGFLLYQEGPLTIVHFVFVEGACRGRGIGSLLVDMCPTPFLGVSMADGFWARNGCEFRQAALAGVQLVLKGCVTPEDRKRVDEVCAIPLVGRIS